jgi:hypothetical protein
MADGYAQVTGRPAVLNLHTSAGLGNAIGNLTNAQANGTPLVVTAGQQDRRHLHHDPLLAGDLVGLAASVAKWTHEVTTLGELGTIMRRAFSDAAAAPSGPVFVSIPMDLLEEVGDAPVPARLHDRPAGVAGGLDELARRLAGRRPGPAAARGRRRGGRLGCGARARRGGGGPRLPGARVTDPLERRVPDRPPALGRSAAPRRRAGSAPPSAATTSCCWSAAGRS